MSCSDVKYICYDERRYEAYVPKSIEYKNRRDFAICVSTLFFAIGCTYILLAGLLYGSNMEILHTRVFLIFAVGSLVFMITSCFFKVLQFKHLEQEMKKEKTPKTSDT